MSRRDSVRVVVALRWWEARAGRVERGRAGESTQINTLLGPSIVEVHIQQRARALGWPPQELRSTAIVPTRVSRLTAHSIVPPAIRLLSCVDCHVASQRIEQLASGVNGGRLGVVVSEAQPQIHTRLWSGISGEHLNDS